jgi:hypothetical protein
MITSCAFMSLSLSLSLISLFLEFLCTDQMGRNRLVHDLHGLDRDGMGWW